MRFSPHYLEPPPRAKSSPTFPPPCALQQHTSMLARRGKEPFGPLEILWLTRYESKRPVMDIRSLAARATFEAGKCTTGYFVEEN